MKTFKNKRLAHIVASHDAILSEWHQKPPMPSALSKYGITQQEWQAMALAQGYCCAICLTHLQKKKLAVDHCHQTGKVRGLLCHHCNTALGHLRDNPLIIESALRYINKHK
jgi:hypothetical protein